MQRITITLDNELLAELDALIAARGYQNRSAAVRELARVGMQQALLETGTAPECVAAIVYVYDYAARDLALRLAALYHANHDLSVATTQVPLGHDSGLEVALLKGPTEAVGTLADAVITERGVRHGRVFIVPAVLDDDPHRHDRPRATGHTHTRTR
jgi:CopG family nickel-responsive transcriptional regulator